MTEETQTENQTDDTAVDEGATAPETIETNETTSILAELRHENGKILGKFEDEKSLAEGYRNLEKEFSKTRKLVDKVPDEYDIKLDESLTKKWNFNADDPRLTAMLPKFKEMNLGNEKVNQIVNSWIASEVASAGDVQEEIAKLGDGSIIAEIDSYANTLDTDSAEAIRGMVTSAAEAKAIHGLITNNRQSIPASSSEVSETTKAEMQAKAFEYQEKHSSTIGSNPAQQAEFYKLLRGQI